MVMAHHVLDWQTLLRLGIFAAATDSLEVFLGVHLPLT